MDRRPSKNIVVLTTITTSLGVYFSILKLANDNIIYYIKRIMQIKDIYKQDPEVNILTQKG